jgi:hypothetical protein
MKLNSTSVITPAVNCELFVDVFESLYDDGAPVKIFMIFNRLTSTLEACTV